MSTYTSENSANDLSELARGLELAADLDGVNSLQQGLYSRRVKRMLDFCVANLGILLCLPLLATTWLVLRIRLGPNVVLRQERVGLDGQPFPMFKFRTMLMCRRVGRFSNFVGPDRRRNHKSPIDPRHTRVGRLVRRFSLDELPQLVNIARGDMSLVGPRPELESVASPAFRSHIRHAVKPGLTGPYQVSDMRSDGCLEDGLRLDEEYVNSVTWREDLRYLTQTLAILHRGSGS